MAKTMRVGVGFDMRVLQTGSPLCMAGINIPFEKGIESTCELDVLTYAIAESLIGSAGLGEIKDYLAEIKNKNDHIYSITFLKEIERILNFEKFKIGNIDISLIFPDDSIAQYKIQIQQNITENLFLKPNQVNLKINDRTYPEVNKGFEKVYCYAVALLLPK